MSVAASARRTRKTAAVLPAITLTAEGREVRVPASALTLNGFRAWAVSDDFPTRGRLAFIDGELFIDMSPEEISAHALVKGEVGSVLYVYCKKEDLGVVLPDRVLLSNEDAGLSNEPDGSFISFDRLESGAVRLVPREEGTERYMEVLGSPDWVMEIVSDSSVRKDTKRLFEVYHRAGIPEYWIIDARGDQISFTIYYAEKDGYVAAPVEKGWQRSVIFGRSFRLDRQRGRGGLWRYTLRLRK